MLSTSRLRLHNEAKQLEVDLKKAHDAYLIAISNRPDEAEDLARVGVLEAVCNYLRAVGIDQRYWDPLLNLWDKNKEKLDLAEAAAVVTVMMRAREKSAINKVAAAGGLDKLRLKNFRNNLLRDPPRGPKAAIALYRRLLSAATASGVPLSEQAQALLRGLREKSDKKV